MDVYAGTRISAGYQSVGKQYYNPMPPCTMHKILVWDLPHRIFHWTFAGSLTAAMAIAFLVDHEQPLFQMHMLLGIVAVFMLLIRLVMGIAGSRYSRFASYPLHPREVIGYMFSAVLSKTRLYAGSNPGSALAAVLMFVLVPALLISGVAYGAEALEELHELFAWGLLAVVILHIAGLTWHTIRHRENISLTMITGRKAGSVEDAISSAHPIWGGIVLLASVVWITALFARYNPRGSEVRLPFTGVTLQLGENESDGGHHERGGHKDND